MEVPNPKNAQKLMPNLNRGAFLIQGMCQQFGLRTRSNTSSRWNYLTNKNDLEDAERSEKF